MKKGPRRGPYSRDDTNLDFGRRTSELQLHIRRHFISEEQRVFIDCLRD